MSLIQLGQQFAPPLLGRALLQGQHEVGRFHGAQVAQFGELLLQLRLQFRRHQAGRGLPHQGHPSFGALGIPYRQGRLNRHHSQLHLFGVLLQMTVQQLQGLQGPTVAEQQLRHLMQRTLIEMPQADPSLRQRQAELFGRRRFYLRIQPAAEQ